MQTLFIFFSLVYFWANTLFADEIPKEPIKVEVLITQIKSAKPEDRRTLMNQLKLQLRATNQGSRAKAMMNLRKSFAKNAAQGQTQKQHSGMKHHEKTSKPQHAGQRAGGAHKGMQQGQQKGQR